MPDLVKSKKLREDRAKIDKTIRDFSDKFLAEKREMSAEERETWKKMNDDYNSFTSQIEVAERAESLDNPDRVDRSKLPGHRDKLPRERSDREPTPDEVRSLCLNAWCRSQFGIQLTKRQAEACKNTRFNPRSKKLTLRLWDSHQANQAATAFRSAHPNRAVEAAREATKAFEKRMSSVTGASGAYLIPPASMLSTIEINLLAYGSVRSVAQTIRTASGEPLVWPTVDDTSNEGEQLGEKTDIGASVDPVLAPMTMYAYKFSSKAIRVPYELLEDSTADIPTLIAEMIGERLGRITNRNFTTGDGAGKPWGIASRAAAGVTAALTTAIAADELLTLIHSVDTAYRMNAGFMMHDNTLLNIRLLKDGAGNYLFGSNLALGAPDTIRGYPISINQHMASSLVASAVAVIFGQLLKYKIRTVNQIRMYRLEERYRDTDEDGFVAFLREDGNLLNAGTAPVKKLTMAA